jgi:hypothetical protein
METGSLMNLRLRFKLAPSLPLLAIFFSLSCNYDHGLDPVRSRIRGEIIFNNTPAPEHVREVAFVAVKKLPPDNLLTDVVFSDPLPINIDPNRFDPDTVRFDIVADLGHYDAAGVLWRRKNEAWDIANILGLYTLPGQLTPRTLELTEDHPVADSVQIQANWDLAKRDAIIEGDLTFEDEWPANTELVAVAFFPVIPRTQFDYILYLKGLDINVKKFSKTYHYRTAVTSGEYKFIALFWFGKGGSLASIRAVGFHSCPNDPLRPKPVAVAPGATLSGVDFSVRFSSLPNGVNFCKDCGDCP